MGGAMAEIYATIGRMIASVPESKTMEVYEAVKALVDPRVPEYLMAKVNEKDAKAAYEALIEFTEVVKANPIAPTAPVTAVSSSDSASIEAAASELGKASYPFIQGINWMDDLYTKPVPGKSAQDVMPAIDAMIVLGTKMDSAALQEAARAHVSAIEGMDASGVLKQGDYEAILAGIGKAIAGATTGNVMDVYYEMGRLIGGNFGLIPTNLFSMQKAADAGAAYTAFLDFKEKVKAAQPQPSTAAQTGATGGKSSDTFTVAALVFFDRHHSPEHHGFGTNALSGWPCCVDDASQPHFNKTRPLDVQSIFFSKIVVLRRMSTMTRSYYSVAGQ